MKLAVIVYHKNISKIYPSEWIDRFRQTILMQTVTDFDIIECNYGNTGERIFNDSIYFTDVHETFVHCMNWCFTYCTKNMYDYIFNTNVDDYYSLYRIERQLVFLKGGVDIVSSNFKLIEDDKEVCSHQFNELNLIYEFRKNNNIIGHPVVAYSRKFFAYNRYRPEEIPAEDFLLWKRTINKYKYIVLPDYLLFHRLHKNSVCKSQNR